MKKEVTLKDKPSMIFNFIDNTFNGNKVEVNFHVFQIMKMCVNRDLNYIEDVVKAYSKEFCPDIVTPWTHSHEEMADAYTKIIKELNEKQN